MQVNQQVRYLPSNTLVHIESMDGDNISIKLPDGRIILTTIDKVEELE